MNIEPEEIYTKLMEMPVNTNKRIYYGDEIGMTGAGDPDNRRMMRFSDSLNADEQKQIKNVTKLIRLRKEHAALRRGDYLPLYLDQNTFIFSRGDVRERLLIALNKGKRDKTVQLLLPGWLKGKSVTSLLTQKRIEILNQNVTLDLPAWSGDIYLVL